LVKLLKYISLIFSLLTLTQSLSALDINITGKEAGFLFRGEYNRALIYELDLSAFGAIELNGRYSVKGGLALGNTGGEFDLKTLVQGQIGPLFKRPFYASLTYIYNGMPSYDVHSHTLLPFVSYKGRRAGISLGPGLRFTRFFGESSLFESMLSFSVYLNFINNEKLRIGISWANFDSFYAGNMGAYSLRANSLIRVNKRLAVVNDVEVLQSGSVGLAANFYGIAYSGGISLSW
jgi:hypothetical protein